ncbi:MAG: alanyl-tRNA editing protein [Alphaproteobacteria bacterium]|jgi:misacylated tRNA(Ala) deacylase|nr:alanyl-tRNA editing protein [Alphaproteobacteria bacterium]HJP21011.1 alanyl-tRNA editing protein [Alphaproteobacteria bacterium]
MEMLFRDDAYARSCDATVTVVDARGIQLDRTVFYPTGGGQPGDSGNLRSPEGDIEIVNAIKGDGPDGVIHVPAEGVVTPAVDSSVTAELDWQRRYRLMRMHTCLHLLSAALSYPVTGGQVGDGKGRLDFDIPDAVLDKEEITAELNRLIAGDITVSAEWISDAELAAQPELVKTMSVKPPIGAGQVRLIRIDDLDLQPCGGTHVARTGEIGGIEVRKIQKKGRLNRRVSLVFAD